MARLRHRPFISVNGTIVSGQNGASPPVYVETRITETTYPEFERTTEEFRFVTDVAMRKEGKEVQNFSLNLKGHQDFASLLAHVVFDPIFRSGEEVEIIHRWGAGAASGNNPNNTWNGTCTKYVPGQASEAQDRLTFEAELSSSDGALPVESSS